MSGQCPICGDRNSIAIYSAQRQPLLLNHLHRSRDAALRAPAADLDFKGCVECGFVWNAAFDPQAIHYGPGYINDQSESAVFRQHLNEVTNRLLKCVAKTPGSIIEIGCGQGTFLKSLCRRASRPGIGFDPAYRETAPADADVIVRNELFTACAAAALMDSHQSISLIICRHVLEHLDDPALMIQTIAGLMRTNPTATLYLEVPAAQWIAEHAAFYDFFNEHCSLFSMESMRRMLIAEGFAATQIEPVFHDQYLAVEASLTPGSDRQRAMRGPEIDHRQCATRLLRERDQWAEHLDDLLAIGPALIWGAGAKGVSLVNQLGLSSERIPFLIDINPFKHGCFAPLTAQEVIGPEAWRAASARASVPPTVIVMNPNYVDEVEERLVDLGINADVEVIGGSNSVEVHC